MRKIIVTSLMIIALAIGSISLIGHSEHKTADITPPISGTATPY